MRSISLNHLVIIGTALAPVPARPAGLFLQTLAATGGGVVVVYGTNPSSLTAANIIRDALRGVPGQSGNGAGEYHLSLKEFGSGAYFVNVKSNRELAVKCITMAR